MSSYLYMMKHQDQQIYKGTLELSFYRPSLPEQQTLAQHSMQPKQATAVQSCVNAIAHWLFILEQTSMQHMQQQ